MTGPKPGHRETRRLSTKESGQSGPDQLRGLAEKKLKNLGLQQIATLSPEETRRLLHELQVHQIELEMQNEELRRAQEELAASRARYFDLYDLAPVGYCTVTEKGLIQEANLTAATLLNVARSQLVKQPLSRFILNEDQDIFYLKRKQLFETSEPQAFELRMLREDGMPFWVHMESSAGRDEEGAPVCRLVMSDISERKQLEDARAFMARCGWPGSDEEFFPALARYLAETLQMDFVCIDRLVGGGLSARTVAVYHDGKFEDNVEYTLHDTPCGEVVGKQICCFSEGVRHLFPRDTVLQEMLAESYLGTTLWSSRGQPIGLIAVIGKSHLKNRKLAEDLLQLVSVRAAGELERWEAEEDREKMRDQLHQAQKLEAVGKLAGGVAHDFNNMLGIILGHAEMLLDEIAPGDPSHHDVTEIKNAAHRSADLTRQLLAFARKEMISPRMLDLNETAAGIMKMLQRLIGEEIDLRWEPGQGLWPVRMDPSQIDQILANLAVNARDAIEGIGTLTIETANVSFDEAYQRAREGFAPGDYVMLAVSDTGTGMDKETLGRIFEPFFTTKEVGKGTGLGLSTVYGIVKQNNGLIDVYSEPGKGTVFKIYLPRTDRGIEEEPLPIKKKDLRGNETVLLVEDEREMLNLGKTILERHGYAVLATSSPREALRMAQSHQGPIHLLITDVVMPEMNGRDLKEQLGVVRSGFKCIFMSGYTGDIIADRGVLDEGLDFLQKPFSVKALAEKVREVLDE